VLRHFHFQFDVARVHGADVNKRNVWWVQKHLPRAFEVFHNHALPHLPIEDRSFDIVFAISVFTHIDHLEQSWLLELRRILRPGGVLVISAHTERTWATMGPEYNMYANLLKRSAEVLEGPVAPETFKSPMPRERVTFTVPGRLASNCQVFHSTEYIRRVWARFMDVAEIRPAAFVNHDAVVMRRA
jgi:SAM-dependent methyltransferase